MRHIDRGNPAASDDAGDPPPPAAAAIVASTTTAALLRPARLRRRHFRPRLPPPQSILPQPVEYPERQIVGVGIRVHTTRRPLLRPPGGVRNREYRMRRIAAHATAGRAPRPIRRFGLPVHRVSIAELSQRVRLRDEAHEVPVARGTGGIPVVETRGPDAVEHRRRAGDHVRFHGRDVCASPSPDAPPGALPPRAQASPSAALSRQGVSGRGERTPHRAHDRGHLHVVRRLRIGGIAADMRDVAR